VLPIRYYRMLESPFAFYRGAASIMASDLQTTPTCGIRTQIGGDAHLLNFGAFGTPERRFVFDIDDFDETTIGAWEWDVKRLATSVEIAGRHLGLRPRDTRDAVRECLRSYRERMHVFATSSILDVWYARIDESVLADLIDGAAVRAARSASASLEKSSDARVCPTDATRADGSLAIADEIPKVFHPTDRDDYEAAIRGIVRVYAETLSFERRVLFERFRLLDAAYKVVGVGSVGTRCSVLLFAASTGETLWLQTKEARASVFERYRLPSDFASHAERVVAGQRLMQSSSDIFLGCASAPDGRQFYVRQLHDMKTSPNVDAMDAGDLRRYAGVCAWALARAHARASGRAASIAGYLGRSFAFDDAVAHFARAYADQNQKDFEALGAARDDGRIVASENGGFSAA
jgi:uncharacterized protein (DUF2252 family)